MITFYLFLQEKNCRFYNSKNGCRYGGNCKFRHTQDRVSTGNRSSSNDTEETQRDIHKDTEDTHTKTEDTVEKNCRFYNSKNGCRYGGKCKFRHTQDRVSTGNRSSSNDTEETQRDTHKDTEDTHTKTQ